MSDFKKMDRLLKEFAERTVPGCACTIMKEDEILYEGYAGFSNIEAKELLTSEAIFRQASTTKLFTYTILAMLYEEGRMLLTDPLYEYLPEWKNMKKFYMGENNEIKVVPCERPITIKDAVTMSCGLPYCMFPEIDSEQPVIAAMSKALLPILKKERPALREEVRVMADVPLLFEPGTHWLYGFGSEITGALVEVIAGKPLRQLFKERLIEPLGLKSTDTYINDSNRNRVVCNYEKDIEGHFIKLKKESDNDYDPLITPVDARPSILTSTRDFAVLMQMLANGGTYLGERFLGRKTVDLMRTNYLNEAQLKDFTNVYLAGYGYGLGFRTVIDKAAGNHNGSLGAFGWTGGSGVWVEADPEEGISIAYMHNMRPNEELYHHLRVRTVAYGCIN